MVVADLGALIDGAGNLYGIGVRSDHEPITVPCHARPTQTPEVTYAPHR